MIQTHLYIPTNLNPNNDNHVNNMNPQDDIIPLCLKKLHDEEKSNNGHYHSSCTGTTSSNTSGTTTGAVPFSSSCRCDLQEYVSDEHYRILSQNATAALESCHCVEVYNPTTMIPCQQKEKKGKEGDHRHPHPPRPAAPVIYVHQRELAHASSQQYNNYNDDGNSMGGAVLASDSATTCHIVAFQSVVQLYLDDDEEKKNNNNDVLGTLCHFDSMENGTIWTCLEDILQHHVQYHCTSTISENEYNTRQEGSTTCTRNDDDDDDDDNDDDDDDDGDDSTSCCFEKRFLIQLDVHMIGGYDDDQKTSNAITHEIISSLVTLAFQWRDIVKMTLKTCIVGRLNNNNNKNTQVSSMLQSTIQNDDCWTAGSSGGSSSSSTAGTSTPTTTMPLCVSSPILRGLAMNVALGEGGGRIYLLKHHVDKSLVGPEPILRHVRLWSSAPEAKEMLTVHDYDQERIVLRPFTFYAFHGVETLMRLPDDVLLQYTSTSPECESEDFCDGIRKVCRYLMQTRVEDVFGPEDCRKSLIFKYGECKENKEGQEQAGERGTIWMWKKDV